MGPAAGPMRTLEALTRERIPEATLRVLHQGGPDKADLLLLDLGEGPFVLKDFAGKGRWTRALGCIQISREAAAYGWLEGVAGVPRLLGKLDRHALAIEHVDGERLADAPIEDAAGVLGRLRDLVDRLHARGVVHNDLRSRENLLVDGGGRLFVVDLAGALRLRPGGILHRLLFPALSAADEAAYLRWKERLAPGTFTPEERARLRRFARFRRLWPFNRKRRREDPG